jgi:hypothetical protein
MGTDISRVRHDPLKDFAGIALQQGRLLLDADFNEYVTILDRRLRAETMDLTSYGPDPTEAGVAWVPRLTPDGFRVTAAGASFTIGRGRMYIDGLMAENHGLPPLAFDDLLREETGTLEVPYEQQAYWLTPEEIPTSGTHLAYLDVWQREVTHLEEPDLIETAIGVDTAARLQTVWQVRVLANAGVGACAADDVDLDGWLEIIQPSSGRLTTDTIEIDPTDDPCKLPPSGGYRGVENQTYRIEVHEGGAPGTATFKWSRDNRSVAVPVAEMLSTTSLRLDSLGRDDVLRISTGDWVEIIDDHREFNQRPGAMRQVVVDDAARTISFTGALPANLRPADAADALARHFRVRRWDQSGTVLDGAGDPLVNLDAGTAGVIEIPASSATQVVLEHGIVALFSTAEADGVFRPGDYWIVAARTADTSVELLTDAPPLGIQHHYARLGTVTLGGGQTDCRTLWPPLFTGDGDNDGCACTLCVTAESHANGAFTLQAAIDSIGATGGTICLGPGLYNLPEGVTVDQARNLRIRGQGMATVLVSQGTAISVQDSVGVTIENLAVIAGVESRSALSLRNVISTNVHDTALLAFGSPDSPSAAIRLSGAMLLVGLRRNVLVGRVGIDGSGNDEVGVVAADLSIEDNTIGGLAGIDLGGRSLYLLSCRIAANELVALGDGIRATGVAAPSGALDVTANNIVATGIGIEVGADVSITHNAINSLGDQEEQNTDRHGIAITQGPIAIPAGEVQVLANRIRDRQGIGIVLETAASTFMVKQNIIDDVSNGIAIAGRGSAEHVAIDNNIVKNIGRTGKTRATTAFGIAVTNSRYVEISSNSVTEVGAQSVTGSLRAGILTIGCRDQRVAGNVVRGVGPPEVFVGFASGILLVGPFERTSVADNSVVFNEDREFPQEGLWSALVVSSSGLPGLGNRGSVAAGNQSLVLTDGWGVAVAPGGGHATVSHNSLGGGGRQATCLVNIDGDAVVSANQCSYTGELVGMQLRGDSVAASSNRLRGSRGMLLIQASEERFSAVGNLAAGGTHLNSAGGGLPGPWDALNPTVP